MAWATAWADRIHIVGGYGKGRVDRTYHHVYDPTADRWYNAAPLPRWANHVGSPILLRFKFTLDHDRISRLEIAP